MLNLPSYAEYSALEDRFIRMLISCVCEPICTCNWTAAIDITISMMFYGNCILWIIVVYREIVQMSVELNYLDGY